MERQLQTAIATKHAVVIFIIFLFREGQRDNKTRNFKDDAVFPSFLHVTYKLQWRSTLLSRMLQET